MGIKYYYSVPQQLRWNKVLADANGHVILDLGESKFIKNLPRVIVCSILAGSNLSFGYATCCSKDQYTKKLGRHIAKNWAIMHPYKTVTVNTKEDIHKFTDDIIAEIYEKESNRIFR